VPIYITASVLAVAVAWYSDRVGKRYPFILVCLCIMAVGFIMCVASATPGVIYAGVFIAACALYPAFPGNITWLSNSESIFTQLTDSTVLMLSVDLAGSTKRATGQAIQIAIGNLAGGMFSAQRSPKNMYTDPYSHGFQLLQGRRCAALYPWARAGARLHRRRYYRVTRPCVELQEN
jgi:MFS family permease